MDKTCVLLRLSGLKESSERANIGDVGFLLIKEKSEFMKLRVNYIDNLRTVTISLLIVYHAAMAYNSWGESNYIFFGRVNPIASIVVFMSPWFMPVMFLLAGVSASFSMKKRGCADFIKERFQRLGIPLLFGVAFINPILSFIADKSHNGYGGSYFEHYSVYFTRFTDLTGYDGGFTLGHFWFIAVLIVISCIGCGVIKVIDRTVGNNRNAMLIINIILMLLAVASFDITLWSKKIPAYLCVYLLGYYLFSRQDFIEKLVSFKWLFIVAFALLSAMNVILFVYVEDYRLLNTICNYLSFAAGIPALVCFGKTCLDYTGTVSRYCAKLSYVFYIVHFPIVVLCQYFISLTGAGSIYNFVLSLVISSVVTCVACCIIDKTAIRKNI